MMKPTKAIGGEIWNRGFDELDKLVTKLDPLQVLAWNTLDSIGEDSQASMEILQSSLLRHHRDEYQNNGIKDEGSQIQANLNAIQLGYSFALLSNASHSSGMQFHTQRIRGWGHDQQVENALHGIFHPIDSKVEPVLGLGILTLYDYLKKVALKIESRVKKHFQLQKHILEYQGPSKNLVATYCQIYPDFETTQKHLIPLLNDESRSIEEVRFIFEADSQLRLSSIFSFNIEDMEMAIDSSSLAKMLDQISMKFGDLKDINLEHLFLSNPVWEKPVINLGNGKYFWCNLNLLLTYPFRILGGLLVNDVSLKTAYEDSRAAFLEGHVENLLKEYFPPECVFTQSLYFDPKEGENDALCVVEDYALVLESKSSAKVRKAERGGEEGIKTALKDTVLAPSLQARRFSQFLQTNIHHELKKSNGREINVIDLTESQKFIEIGIPLERTGWLNTKIEQLISDGLLPPECHNTLSIPIADFQTICELLKLPALIIHYLLRRIWHQNQTEFIGDEQDLLAHYLKTGLAESDTELQVDLTFEIRDYYLDMFKERPIRKHPEPAFFKGVIKECEVLDQKRSHNWLQNSLNLLDSCYK